MPSPEEKQNCYTTFDEPVYFFSDDAIVFPPKTKPSAEQPTDQPPEPSAEQPDQKS